MRKHDTPSSIKVACSQVVDEQLVVGIDIGSSDIVRPDAPVERVVLPYDRL